jgi:hypothetical protein
MNKKFATFFFENESPKNYVHSNQARKKPKKFFTCCFNVALKSFATISGDIKFDSTFTVFKDGEFSISSTRGRASWSSIAVLDMVSFVR